MTRRLKRLVWQYIITAQPCETFVCLLANTATGHVLCTKQLCLLLYRLDGLVTVFRSTDGHRTAAPPCHSLSNERFVLEIRCRSKEIFVYTFHLIAFIVVVVSSAARIHPPPQKSIGPLPYLSTQDLGFIGGSL